MSVVLSRRDVDFLLFEWLDAVDLTTRERYSEHSRETFDAVIDLAEAIATERFAPINRLLDTHEPFVGEDGKVVLPAELADALRVYARSGMPAATFDAEVGGMQLPFTVGQGAFAFLQAASAAAASYPFLSTGNANLLVAHGSAEQVERYALPVIEGRWYGTMALSEPQAGSSLGDITTRAVRQPDGTYRLFGTKMWISGGDHELSENIVHLVLAKVEGAPPGVKGISLFIVPKYLVEADGSLGERNDVALVGLNHKMGWRGTTNTLLNFGEGLATPGGVAGAVGDIVGEEGQGLAQMFHMMNEARISVGMGAVALGYTGYLHSLEYAKQRTQGRVAGAKDPALPQVPLVEHADVRRMLLAQKSYVEGGLGLLLYCARLIDEQVSGTDDAARDRARELLEVLTPIAKSWPSQWCLAANDLAIQVHGGSGYTRDYAVEQFYRDNRLNPIHEGTHGIQSLDLLGRKVVAGGGAALGTLVGTIKATTARAAEGDETVAAYAAQLDARVDRLVEVTGALWAGGDPAVALANSAVYLEAAGHVVMAWIWLEQLLAVGDRTDAFYDGKRAAGRYFFAFELPKVDPQFDLLASLDRTVLDLDPAVL
ncbi:acyl-CoA dehydrogenase [Aeromicrobium sp. 636]|uniref:Acyl-CoA dehydrogenase n=1 Tax=Aeromicrobium senzhongii TaxID=2663859 RepID=A0A8I0EUX4_9ACTN|nr:MULTISPECIES: acyl-CoA dehydrogenase [Aeromicrobium]MBC9225530.1 acyl-CoA dehydrogenase [Aeromicrobium senzhongii]MCQ3997640.1 acyl-CoA dehydrogenase [Aeromicrobium sp. 636]